MAAWRRCEQCRKVLPASDFESDSPVCAADVVKATAGPTRRAAPVSTRRAVPASAGPQIAVRDIRGRGDHEVRARRARGRALERLAELHGDDFDHLLGEERTSEGL